MRSPHAPTSDEGGPDAAALVGRQNKDSNLSLQEFRSMVARSPLHNKYSEKQLLHLYSELTSDHGVLTKRDWLSLFHHVEVCRRAQWPARNGFTALAFSRYFVGTR